MLYSANPVDVVVSVGSAATAAFDVHCVPELVGRIAFTSMRDGNDDIYLIGPDGSDPVNWTHQPTAEGGASISPDGLAIAFTSHATGDWEIWAAYVDGTGLIQLTDAPGFDGTPSWSPDGSKIAFGSDRDGNKEIYVMNANGSDQVNVSNRPFSEEEAPHWSPDGKWIAFHSDRTGTWQLFTMSSDGSSQAQLTHNFYGAAGPAWSPLGNEIAYYALGDELCFCAHIRIVKANGADPKRITYPPRLLHRLVPRLVAGRHADRVHLQPNRRRRGLGDERRRLGPGQRHQQSGRRRRALDGAGLESMKIRTRDQGYTVQECFVAPRARVLSDGEDLLQRG